MGSEKSFSTSYLYFSLVRNRRDYGNKRNRTR